MRSYLLILLISLNILGSSLSRNLQSDQSKKRILVAGQYITSLPGTWYQISRELKKNENYEVYQILPADSPYVERIKANGVIPILSKNFSQQYFDEYNEQMKENKLKTSALVEYMQYLTKAFFSEDELIKEIKLRNRLSEHIVCGLGSYMIHNKLYNEIPEHLRQDAMTLRAPDLILYTGYEGLSQAIPLSPNSRIIPPLFENETQTQQIAQDLQEFIDRHQKLILVSFGTVQSPKSDTLRALSKYMQQQSDYGFIYSATNQKYLEKDILERVLSLENVYISNWIPQIQLLNNPKVKIFFSHGGLEARRMPVQA
ncbi:antennal-enriched udp-glycosyltransferase [Stylonychia lemnae]|uniref:Antennal-enriched udp-glycosyltransferase n=1 Tax=Stylonychia lemnae TaxID=5949 RepID=A0A078AUW5_STYLE|nr:antennal-enriched udp-glycosyltransferase [Stylonychia lemnae]|eukprot:CDW86185.1 antennal-enriched udp-glycosyltransferase [Stylonychia lemnae]